MGKKDIYALLKFSSNKERLVELLETGRLWFGTVDHFKNAEKEKASGQFDELDSAITIVDMAGGTIRVDHPEHGTVEFKSISGILQNYEPGNIACFFGITLEHLLHGKFLIDDRMGSEFGDHVLFIHNANKFIDMVDDAIAKVGAKGKRGWVKYDYESAGFEGDIDSFSKRKHLAYQNEYRYFLNSGATEKFPLEIGPLHDVAMLITLKSLKLFTFDVKRSQ